MLTRRRLLLLTMAGTSLAALKLHPALAQPADAASAFINRIGTAMASIANGPGDDAQRKAQLAAVVEQAVDVDSVARFCLGRFWRLATPAQQQEYVQLFHHVLVVNITGHLGDYRGVGFQLGRVVQEEGATAVQTVVTRPGQAPANVDWVVEGSGAGMKIIDVIAEGTSLRLTQRSDYSSYLARNGNNVGALIAAMRRQAAGS